jgi:hypothetical protein
MHRTILPLVGALALAGCSSVPYVPLVSERVKQATTIVWAGLDYSQVQMVGTDDFRDPSAIFPGYLDSWNGLFVAELVEPLEKRLGKKIVVDIDGMYAQNKKATPAQVIRKDGDRSEYVDKGHITSEDLAAAVKGYSLKAKEGVGLVYVVERLVKAQHVGCLYIVFFDIGTREILECRRGVYPAGGMGFRNFWFRPIKGPLREF